MSAESQSQLVCLRYNGSIDVLLEKLRLEELEERHKKECKQTLYEESSSFNEQQSECSAVQVACYGSMPIEEKQEAVYEIAHRQNFPSLRPQWAWLSIKICTFVEPPVAKELEQILLYAMMETHKRPLILRNGDVIVSEKYLELITSVISNRTGSTPRYNRPKVIDRIDVPMLGPLRQEATEGLKHIREKADEETLPLCRVCMDLPRQTVFIQCGHISMCLPCFNEEERKAAEQSTAVRCPICRGGGNVRRVYFP